MKKIILFMAFTGLILSVNAQDTLKWKTIKTYYGDIKEDSYVRIGELDGAVINTDTLSELIPELLISNVSHDTFPSGVGFEYIIDFYLYADTGLLLMDHNVSTTYFLPFNFYPNNTISLGSIGFMGFPLLTVINYIEGMGIDFKEISYWKIITGINYTSKDGYYSEKVFYEGADTCIFYIKKGNVGIQVAQDNSGFTVYPNPTNGVLQIMNSALRNECIEIYDMAGRIVKTVNSPMNNTINVSDIQNGMYFIAVYSNGERAIRKFVKQ